MTKLFFQQFIIIILIVLVILSIILGSFLPLIKSQKFISAIRTISSIKTIDEFKANFDKPLKFYSPVGDEEIVKYLSNNIVQIISQSQQSEQISRILTEYIEPYFFQNNIRHLLTAAELYFVLWQKSGRDDDFQKAEKYYLKALTIGPKLPPTLYSLFGLYQARGDQNKAKEIGEIILKYWPEDEKIKKILRQ